MVSEVIHYVVVNINMVNVNNILYIFNNLVREEYRETTQTKPLSKDYELTDQLFVLFNQLFVSTELLDNHIVISDFGEYG